MAHLLVVESWVGSMSRLLPRALGEGGHHFTFLTRDLQHYLRSAPEGTEHPLLTARNVVTAPTNDVGTLLPQAERLHEALRFDGVITSCDYYLPTAARIAARLGLPGPAAEAMENACRKDATRRILDAAGLPGPRFAVCTDAVAAAEAARAIGYPLVVKPVDLCAGMLVRRVDDETELAAACDALAGFPVNARGQLRTPHILLEEFLRGPEVSVETVSYAGTTHVVGVTDKSVGGAPAFIETGHMFPAALGPDDLAAATGTALRAGAALGLDDVVAHTEIKLTPDGPRVVEVNPRPAGNRITELVRHVTGIDLAAACVDVALGREPDLRRRDTGLRSAAIGFLVPEAAGTLASVEGAAGMRDADGVLEVQMAEPGRKVGAADSNNAYLGHVMAGDAAGLGARDRVESLLAAVRPRLVLS
ncbi:MULTISPECIES: ATP-grasp domain-containing protein [Streptomyces]|uniref:Biotin carboxylase n=1 Tax=Streptomyces clavifer TaxID=68188 RepID=A0ABS4VJV4_9ACTN|nr:MULTISPECIES: ATP-grasp domain-containing protein [Streptomyces]KQX83648.1 carboxylate--amine ligase [Streptomyces sp. Root1319]KQZ03091.1 carboxylate--amine ligase [Streptomyces sp. Root55]MBP2364205.1 biotin carboxylase [Streptomyces clavifer]MDX2744372.1 ATP-grasp domain-containing protein [Streptomyces sp. NRRL_B-2557]MDX3065184.1 ATP-grasp domain-containing protein [Streptomyces sp. ND04-05B]